MQWRGSELFPNAALAFHLDSLTRWNQFLMRALPIPPLYSTPYLYVSDTIESEHPENWLDCLEVVLRGGADCKSLATYRVAELREKAGEPHARTVFHKRLISPDTILVHIFVERENGLLEDPSRILGMPT